MKVGMACLLLGLALALPAVAEGAGGLELTHSITVPGVSEPLIPLSGIGGFGYGVLRNGEVVGGFGMGSHTAEESGGWGGTMHGWQHRWGFLVGLFTTKVGFGGVTGTRGTGFSLLGAAEAQMGVLVLPWFDVGFKVGAVGTVVYGDKIDAGWTPVAGLRLSWGAF